MQDGEVSDEASIATTGRLDADQIAKVTALVAAAADTDGRHPLSEHVTLHLRYGGDTEARNVLLWTPDGELAGYAHLDVTDAVEGGSAELVVHPKARGLGNGRALVTALVAQAPPRGLRLWAHGEHPSAARLAEGMGFTRIRALWQMRRSLFAPIPAIPLPPGVRVRTFEPGKDDEAWVELNARAFARHPEQGSWTVDDLHRRMREEWFDPTGFFLAERRADNGRMVGFHWTKVHGGEGPTGHPRAPEGQHAQSAGQPMTTANGPVGHGHEPIGEVYVVGVDPSEQGHGLGKALTVVGLRYLRALGLPEAMLYVEEDNEAAIRVYTALGFTHWDTDVMYRWPTSQR
jgi:mycothiol synthase